MSIRNKIFILVFLTALIPASMIALSQYQMFKTELLGAMEKDLASANKVALYFFDRKQNEALVVTKLYAANPDLVFVFQSGERTMLDAKIAPLFAQLKAERQLSVFEFGDTQGKVFTRGHQPGKFGDDKSKNTSIAAALQGQEVKGFEFGASGLAVRAFVPIKSEKGIIGTIQTGFNLNDDFFSGVVGYVGSQVAFYEKDVLVKSSDAKEKELIGKSHPDSNIFSQVAETKRSVRIEKDHYLQVYYPLFDPSGTHVQGMYRMERDLTVLQQALRKQVLVALGIVVASVLIGSLVAFVFSRRLTRSIIATKDQLINLSASGGDLTLELTALGQDESGQLGRAFNNFLGNLRNIVLQVKTDADEVAQSSLRLEMSIQQTNETSGQTANAANSIAAATVQQAKKVEELGVLSTDIATYSQKALLDAENTVKYVSQSVDATKRGLDVVNVATEQVNKSEESIKQLSTVVSDLKQKSQEISLMNDAIAAIAVQTNLLSLNAAIEAARAGEHGRGFSVVAEEVRKLAEQSQQASEKIQVRVREIQNAVEQSGIAMELSLKEVSETTHTVKLAGERFLAISNLMNNILTTVQGTTDHVRSVAARTTAVEQSAQVLVNGSNEIASQTANISASTEECNALMAEILLANQRLAQIALELNQTVGVFKTK